VQYRESYVVRNELALEATGRSARVRLGARSGTNLGGWAMDGEPVLQNLLYVIGKPERKRE